jgi:cell division septal protein FtsQ
MTEPTRPDDDDDVSDRVLDELKLVFAEPKPGPDAEPEPEAGPAAAPEPAAPITTPTVAIATPAAPADQAVQPARSIIVIGGDDSLPDAVYLDDGGLDPLTQMSVDDSGARNTIIIGNELDSTGAFDAVAVPSRSMDPRVRARRVAVKRARGRKRLLWTSLVVLVVLVGVAVLAVFSSSLFAVEHIDIQGATYTQYTEPDVLQAILDQVEGEPVLLVDTRDIERQLEQIPWIERAFVTTDFPDRVLIDVRERRPLATFPGTDGRYRVIDREGRVLTVLDGRPTDYMLLIGPAPDTEAGGLAGTPFAAAAQMISALPGEIRSLSVAASVDATTGDLGLRIVAPASTDADSSTSTTTTEPDDTDPSLRDDLIEVRIGSSTNLDGKLARLLQLIRNGLDGVVRIDVSTDEVSVTKG